MENFFKRSFGGNNEKTGAEIGDSIFFACAKQKDLEKITSLSRDKIAKDLN